VSFGRADKCQAKYTSRLKDVEEKKGREGGRREKKPKQTNP